MARSAALILSALVVVLVQGPMATADDDGAEPTSHVRWADVAQDGPTVLRFEETPGGGCRGGGSIHMAGADATVPRSMRFVATGDHPCEFRVTAYEGGLPTEPAGRIGEDLRHDERIGRADAAWLHLQQRAGADRGFADPERQRTG